MVRATAIFKLSVAVKVVFENITPAPHHFEKLQGAVVFRRLSLRSLEPCYDANAFVGCISDLVDSTTELELHIPEVNLSLFQPITPIASLTTDDGFELPTVGRPLAMSLDLACQSGDALHPALFSKLLQLCTHSFSIRDDNDNMDYLHVYLSLTQYLQDPLSAHPCPDSHIRQLAVKGWSFLPDVLAELLLQHRTAAWVTQRIRLCLPDLVELKIHCCRG